jgi:hypothetical protein
VVERGFTERQLLVVADPTKRTLVKRRKLNVFGLAFMDCICCGFGAVILLFVMVNSRTDQPPPPEPPPVNAIIAPVAKPVPDVDRTAEIAGARLALQRAKARIRATATALEEMEGRRIASQDRAKRMQQEASQLQQKAADSSERETAARDRVAGLQGDLLALEKEVEQLRAALAAAETPEPPKGDASREFAGDGDRQYLTGLKVGGKRVLILLDCSASMLDHRILEIIRLRNMAPEEARKARKWQQAVRSTEWLLAQLPAESEFQIFGFNESAFPLIEGTAGKWLKVGDAGQLEAAVDSIRKHTPKNGTSLERALNVARALSPMPDNVILLTDGLPTIGKSRGLRRKISADRRLSLFEQAARNWPRDIPVNVLLFPMEGDPQAASSFWMLAAATGGSFFCPAEDWP